MRKTKWKLKQNHKIHINPNKTPKPISLTTHTLNNGDYSHNPAHISHTHFSRSLSLPIIPTRHRSSVDSHAPNPQTQLHFGSNRSSGSFQDNRVGLLATERFVAQLEQQATESNDIAGRVWLRALVDRYGVYWGA